MAAEQAGTHRTHWINGKPWTGQAETRGDIYNPATGTWSSTASMAAGRAGHTATLLGGQTNPDVWRKKIEPTQKLYSWAINNHWETNYRAYQDGIITFRYALQPHKGFDAVASTRLSTALAQPLIVAEATGDALTTPRLQLSSPQLVVLALKPGNDGKAWMVTLYNPTEQAASTTLTWNGQVGAAHYSNTGEEVMAPVEGPITVAPQDVVTIRVEK